MFDPILAETRFGCGLSPAPPLAPPESVAAMLAGLTAPDTMAQRFPIQDYAAFRTRMIAREAQTAIRRKYRGTPKEDAAKKAIRVLNREARVDHLRWMAAHILRRVKTPTPLRERLVFFWADHFTATGKRGLIRRAVSPYMQSALRPHLAGRFEDLLIAAVTHPVMLDYLDQTRSFGPTSQAALHRPGRRGMNENLAREILELHTLGVGGPYTQGDVRELAELLTGLTHSAKNGRKFQRGWAEPGAEIVLGKSYGGTKNPHFRDIEAVLRDLAVHPATARHMARKLAVHFVTDRPDPALVAAIEARWRDTGGDLMQVYEALLTHPAAWDRSVTNFKQPFDFIASACRALEVPRAGLEDMTEGMLRNRFHTPMRLMGHVWQKPDGPDGLAEDDSAWITPQGMAARLHWAMAVPQLIMPELPDPRWFVQMALGGRVPPNVQFAAEAAESRSDGIGLVLASPAFQRM